MRLYFGIKEEDYHKEKIEVDDYYAHYFEYIKSNEVGFYSFEIYEDNIRFRNLGSGFRNLGSGKAQFKEFEICVPKDKKGLKFIIESPNSMRIIYLVEGNIHNENGPAEVLRRNGATNFWYKLNGIYHRLDGPAHCECHEGDSSVSKFWDLNGESIYQTVVWSNNFEWRYTRYHNKAFISIPLFENGEITNDAELTKESVMRGMLANREYGNFLRKKFEESNEL